MCDKFEISSFYLCRDRRDYELLCNYPGIVQQRLSYGTPRNTSLRRRFVAKEETEETKYLLSSARLYRQQLMTVVRYVTY